jgi:hypothetical protein
MQDLETQIKILKCTVARLEKTVANLRKDNKELIESKMKLLDELKDINSKKAELRILKAKNHKINNIAKNLTKIEKAKFQEKL